MAGGGIFTALVLLAMLPFAAAWDIHKILSSQRGKPLPLRNLGRAGWGAFALTTVVVLMKSARLDPPYDTGAFVIGGLALLYLLVGIKGSRGVQVDVMAIIWWLAGAAFAGWLFLKVVAPVSRIFELSRFVEASINSVLIGFVVAALVRVALLLRPVPGPKLPNPAKVPGLPIAGPASPAAAHAALGGRRSGFFHRLFKT